MDPFVLAFTALGAVVSLAGHLVRGHYRARHAREHTLRHHVRLLPRGSTMIDLHAGIVLHVGTDRGSR
ncbi:hypothetical protein [Embleya sp. NPDC059237]|uniref:hypothetical protein n=1 Tax=Embleya sp. NPDC059237 TaxID=3346784 RepID=UPI0036A85411